MANPSRYHNRVIAIEGEHRWLGGDQILYDAKCGPVGGSVLTPAPEDPIESEPPRDTPLDVRRSKVEFIAKGRFEAWQAGVEGFDSSRKGFGKCGCYQGRLTFFSFAYFTLSLAEPNK